MPKPISFLTFRGKRWRLRFVPRLGKGGKGHDGDCDHPSTGAKELRVRQGLSEFDTLETLCHEGMHACLPDLDEDAVLETAHDVSLMLWRLGYRRIE